MSWPPDGIWAHWDEERKSNLSTVGVAFLALLLVAAILGARWCL